MHPAYSVIFFTVFSGAGYGLLAVLCLGTLLGVLPDEGAFGISALAMCAVLIIGGLLSSTLHLYHPERAWRAFSQWRSSWLSREGVAAVATFLPMAVLALGWLLPVGLPAVVWISGALLALVGAIITVWCTAMIYASLKPVPQWCICFAGMPLLIPVYFAFAVSGGMVWYLVLAWLFAGEHDRTALLATCLSILVAWLIKCLYWRRIDAIAAGSAPDLLDAVGLKAHWQRIRAFDAPHTETNYLLKEMGYRVGRKHRRILRQLAWLGGGALPIGLLLAGGWSSGASAGTVAVTAAILVVAGTLLERWLLFAEAQHTSSLYYDAVTPSSGRPPVSGRSRS